MVGESLTFMSAKLLVRKYTHRFKLIRVRELTVPLTTKTIMHRLG